MNTVVESDVKAQCGYCGKPNPDKAYYCKDCGTKLAQEPQRNTAERITGESKPKSLSTGVLLAILVGPLGLLYIEGLIAVGLWFAGILLMIATHRPILVAFAIRFICVTYVYAVLGKKTKEQPDKISPVQWTPSKDPDGQNSLNEAAKLESVNRVKAIEAYERVMTRFPDTPAAREAAANIETLKRNAAKVDAHNGASP